jgi:DNA-binding MarR family transcriptional regulator
MEGSGIPDADRAGPGPDEFDRLLHHTGVPSEDPAVALVGILFRLAPRLVDLIDMGERDYGLGFARGRVLWALRETGPVLMRALSDRLGVSPRTITGLVDSLEADGWVRRNPHPHDRRATIISLTPASETTLTKLTDTYNALGHYLLGDVPAADLELCQTIILQLEARLAEAVSRGVAALDTGQA